MKSRKYEILVTACLLTLGMIAFFRHRDHRTNLNLSAKNNNSPLTFQKKTLTTAELLEQLIARKAEARDPELVRVVKAILIPPPLGLTKFGRGPMYTPQAKAADQILNATRDGFYIECGAYDGETGSTTAWLGVHRGWSGLLIEIDPYYYQQVVGKRRNAWVINACLSSVPHVTMKSIADTYDQRGKVLAGEARNETNGMKNIPCFPLETLMLAINRNKADFFSLDVEGDELDVLHNVPFDRLDFTVLAVEHLHIPGGKEALRTFMDTKGYKVQQDIHYADYGNGVFVEDFIFVKK